MKKERILVTVKTYPQLSSTYGETVCTAGVREDGTWVRIYPVPFRGLNQEEQYKKFDWMDVRLKRNPKDVRPETYRPVDSSEFVEVGHMGTERDWEDRRKLILGKCRVYTNLEEIIADAHANKASLAVFKPSKILRLVVEDDEREWKPERVKAMRDKSLQGELFSEDHWQKTFSLVNKMPYKFSYRFEDDVGKVSELQILDWEIGALYWNCLRRADGDEKEAIAKVRVKYLDQFLKTNLHFFVGTTQRWHQVGPNPWVIIGVFPIPHERQPTFL